MINFIPILLIIYFLYELIISVGYDIIPIFGWIFAISLIAGMEYEIREFQNI